MQLYAFGWLFLHLFWQMLRALLLLRWRLFERCSLGHGLVIQPIQEVLLRIVGLRI